MRGIARRTIPRTRRMSVKMTDSLQETAREFRGLPLRACRMAPAVYIICGVPCPISPQPLPQCDEDRGVWRTGMRKSYKFNGSQVHFVLVRYDCMMCFFPYSLPGFLLAPGRDFKTASKSSTAWTTIGAGVRQSDRVAHSHLRTDVTPFSP